MIDKDRFIPLLSEQPQTTAELKRAFTETYHESISWVAAYRCLKALAALQIAENIPTTGKWKRIYYETGLKDEIPKENPDKPQEVNLPSI